MLVNILHKKDSIYIEFSFLCCSQSETITLRGEQDRLGPALTMVYSKANSVIVEQVAAPEWLHRFIIGKRGVNIKKIMEEYPKVRVGSKIGSSSNLIYLSNLLTTFDHRKKLPLFCNEGRHQYE